MEEITPNKMLFVTLPCDTIAFLHTVAQLGHSQS